MEVSQFFVWYFSLDGKSPECNFAVMHHLTLAEPVKLSPVITLKPDQYICEDLNGAQLMCHAGGGTMSPLTERRPFDETKDWNGKRLLFVRAGGFGDLVLMTPVFREIKRRWPNCILHVSTMSGYSAVLSGLPYIDATIGYPVPEVQAKTYDCWVFFENAIEHNPLAQKMHMTDLFAEITGLTAKDGLAAEGGHPALDDYHADYRVAPEETTWVLIQYPRKPGKKRLCMQVGASARCRQYPSGQFTEIVKEMLKAGWEVFILGAPGEIPKVPNIPDLYNLTSVNTTFRQSCAVINNSDAFVGNDSALLHVAGALKIPAVGLYGPFPWNLRTKYEETTFSFQGKGDCAPCFHHQNPFLGNAFPEHCPSKDKGYCQVLASIDIKRIISKIESIAKSAELQVLE